MCGSQTCEADHGIRSSFVRYSCNASRSAACISRGARDWVGGALSGSSAPASGVRAESLIAPCGASGEGNRLVAAVALLEGKYRPPGRSTDPAILWPSLSLELDWKLERLTGR